MGPFGICMGGGRGILACIICGWFIGCGGGPVKCGGFIGCPEGPANCGGGLMGCGAGPIE